MTRKLIRLIPVLFLAGCATYAYTVIGPGTVEYDGLMVSPSQSWNAAPKQASFVARPESGIWTHDGRMLDQMMIIPAVESGNPLFRSADDGKPQAVYRSGMLPNEIAELVESSVVHLFGESKVAADTSNLRPQKYGAEEGFIFDLSMSVSDGPNYRGICGAFIADEKLYVMLFLAAEPYYFEKHQGEALSVIQGARLSSS